MKRTVIVSALVAALVLAAVVVAQDPGGGRRPQLIEQPKRQRPGPGGVPRSGHGSGLELKRVEREYAEEVRRAHKEIEEMRRKLVENGERLRSLWNQALEAETPEARQRLRPEFERLANEHADIELRIARRHVEIAQKGFDLALQRLIQAKVALREAQIKQHRRKEWFRGEWGKRLREARADHIKELREHRRKPEETPGEEPEDTREAPPDERAE